MNIYDQIQRISSYLRTRQVSQVPIEEQAEVFAGWESDAPALGQAPDPELSLESDSAHDGVDYTGCGGYGWDIESFAGWLKVEPAEITRVFFDRDRVEVPELLGSPEDAWWSDKKGGYDRDDMMGIDFAALAVEVETRPYQAYAYRASHCPKIQVWCKKTKQIVNLPIIVPYRVRTRRSNKVATNYTSRFGEGYTPTVLDEERPSRGRCASRYQVQHEKLSTDGQTKVIFKPGSFTELPAYFRYTSQLKPALPIYPAWVQEIATRFADHEAGVVLRQLSHRPGREGLQMRFSALHSAARVDAARPIPFRVKEVYTPFCGPETWALPPSMKRYLVYPPNKKAAAQSHR